MSEKNNPNKPSYSTGLHSYLYESVESRIEEIKKISEIENESDKEEPTESEEGKESQN